MQSYKYEIHAHTSESSICASINAVELVRFYKNLGFSGLCITDHFLNGNTTVPADHLSWTERINLFCKGYEKAFEEGKRIGIDVFYGWEYSYKGTDLLTYGLDKDWLLNHPETLSVDINKYCDLVHAHGGFIVHAHPFREAHYIAMIRLLPRKVDAVEVENACRLDFENKLADQYAENYGLLKVAGSDNHIGKLDKLCGIEVCEPLDSIHDMIKAIKDDNISLLSLRP